MHNNPVAQPALLVQAAPPCGVHQALQSLSAQLLSASTSLSRLSVQETADFSSLSAPVQSSSLRVVSFGISGWGAPQTSAPFTQRARARQSPMHWKGMIAVGAQ